MILESQVMPDFDAERHKDLSFSMPAQSEQSVRIEGGVLLVDAEVARAAAALDEEIVTSLVPATSGRVVLGGLE